MKVKDFAKLHGVSTQAVYQRLNKFADKNNKDRSDFVSRDTGEITEEGYNALQEMYKLPSNRKTSAQTSLSNLREQLDRLQAEGETKDKLIGSLESRLQDKDREIERLNIQFADLKSDKQFLQTMLEGLTSKPKTGFFRRLFAGSAKTDKQNTEKNANPAITRKGNDE